MKLQKMVVTIVILMAFAIDPNAHAQLPKSRCDSNNVVAVLFELKLDATLRGRDDVLANLERIQKAIYADQQTCLDGWNSLLDVVSDLSLKLGNCLRH